MTTIEFRSLSKSLKAIAFYEAHNRSSRISYYAFITYCYDREDEPWEVHTYSTGLQLHCEYHFETLTQAKEFVSEYLL